MSPYHPSIYPRPTSTTIAVAVPPRLGYYDVHHPHGHAAAAAVQFCPQGSPPHQVLPPVISSTLLCHDSNGDDKSSIPTNVSPRSVVTTHLGPEDGSVHHFRPVVERETVSNGPSPLGGGVAEIVPRRILGASREVSGDFVTPVKAPVDHGGGGTYHQPVDFDRSHDAENVNEQCAPRPSNNRGVADVGRVCTTSPTPQNLRDNPVRLAKVKSELCQYYSSGRRCPFGDRCELRVPAGPFTYPSCMLTLVSLGNYAHGKHELKQRHTTLLQMERSGQIVNAGTYLSRPCMTWVSTGCW